MRRELDPAEPRWVPLHEAAERLSSYLGDFTRFRLKEILERGHVPMLANRGDLSAALPDRIEDLLAAASDITVVSHSDLILARYRFANEQEADRLLGPRSNWRWRSTDPDLERELRWFPLNFENIHVCWTTLLHELRQVGGHPSPETAATLRKLGLWSDSWGAIGSGYADEAPQVAEPPNAPRPAPGPKGGEQNITRLAWEIALQILSSGAGPRRGHGRLMELARRVNTELAKKGHKREDDSIRRAIGPSLREWEVRNPGK